MFTGIIQKVGRVSRWETINGGMRLLIDAGRAWDPSLASGESIAVSGVCLTVAERRGKLFACDVLQETLKKTTLGSKKPGAILNLERALRTGDFLGGHILTGHVDGVAEVVLRKSVGRDTLLRIACNASLLKGMVLHGSIACDGASLTIAALDARSFSVHLVPYTMEQTSFQYLKKGDALNLETDIIGKYVHGYLASDAKQSRLTMDQLEQAGF